MKWDYDILIPLFEASGLKSLKHFKKIITFYLPKSM